ncbi:MAG: hypothetical protein GY761_02925 [Hyphomicrobiales bacterium]|nr:hypothetical protein [Hyphomicrobiales bacterium]
MRIAVIASGPSALLFQGKEDVAIGVNGAGSLLRADDIFVSMFKGAHLRSWFQEIPNSCALVLRPHSAIHCHRMYPDKTLRHALLDFENEYKNSYPEQVKRIETARGFETFVSKEFDDARDILDCIPSPVEPHMIVRRIHNRKVLATNLEELNPLGTSTGTALQIARLLGAKEIFMYGADFSAATTGHTRHRYYKEFPEYEIGATMDHHLRDINWLVLELIKIGVSIYSHSPTNIKGVRQI